MRLEHKCTIYRPGVDTRDIDPESGQPIGEPPEDVTIYAGRCRYTNDGGSVRRAMGGGISVERSGADVSLQGEGLVILPKRSVIVDTETDRIDVVANGVTFRARILRPSYQGELIHLIVAPETRAKAA